MRLLDDSALTLEWTSTAGEGSHDAAALPAGWPLATALARSCRMETGERRKEMVQ
jgi:hypothetical protein